MATLGKDRIITTRAIRGFFAQSFITKRRSQSFNKFCEVRDSYVEQDIAGMLGTVPQVTEIVNDSPAVTAAFTEYQITWRNRLFKALVEIQESLLLYDQTGQTRTIIHSMAARLANYLDKLFYTRLQNATVDLCYDGTPLIGASHVLGGSAPTQSNLVSGQTTTAYVIANDRDVVAKKILDDFAAAKAQMASFVDDNAQPFHDDVIEPTSLSIICSPLMETVMRFAFQTEILNQTTNVLKNAVRDIVVSNYLPITGAAAADWYVVRNDERNKPFVYSRFRQKKDSEMQDNLGLEKFTSAGDDFQNLSMNDLRELSTVEIRTNLGRRGSNAEADTIRNDRFLIGAYLRGEIFPGVWQNIVQIDNTAS